MLPARHRLRRSADFRAVARSPRGARAGGSLVVVQLSRRDPNAASSPGDPTGATSFLTPGGANAARVGFAVGRTVGCAVVRNHTRRRLRALVAARLDGIPAGVDIVIRATPAAAAASFEDLGSEVDRLMTRALERVRTSRAGR